MLVFIFLLCIAMIVESYMTMIQCAYMMARIPCIKNVVCSILVMYAKHILKGKYVQRGFRHCPRESLEVRPLHVYTQEMHKCNVCHIYLGILNKFRHTHSGDYGDVSTSAPTSSTISSISKNKHARGSSHDGSIKN